MLIIYGIKNCDTMKKAFQWLKVHEQGYNFHDYRVDGLSCGLVETFIEQIGLEVLINKRSTSWRALSEAQKKAVMQPNTAVDIVVQTPTLLKRPIIKVQQQYIVGFSPKHYAGLCTK